MSVPRPALLPLLRGENQLRLLGVLLLAPTRSWTISELSADTGIPQPSVSREVARLLTTSVLVAGADRGRRVVQANTESVIFPELASLLLKTVGPRAVLEETVAGAPGVDHALIYGSWARRYAGQVGSEPNDIDLLVIGTPDVDDIRRRTDAASARLGRDVNVTVLSPQEWSSPQSGFVNQIRSSPSVVLDLAVGDDSSPGGGDPR